LKDRKGRVIMKKLTCVLLVFAFVGFGCLDTDPDMNCDDITDAVQCTDGSWPQFCFSIDGSRCGFKMMDRYFYCISCNPVAVVCDDATLSALAYCYGLSSKEDVDELDEFIIEMQVEELVDALDFFKETID
jgi:hypothetical protein